MATSEKGLFLPLYGAKMIYQYDHRFASYSGDGTIHDASAEDKADPHYCPLPRYWIKHKEVQKALADVSVDSWLLAFRKTTNSASERTMITAILPRVAVGDKAPLLFTQGVEAAEASAFLADCNSLVCDYSSRQKIGGNDLSNFIVKQLPIAPPHTYKIPLLRYIVPRVLELTYTAWDLQPFAQDVGWDGPPFVWDEARRFLLRCELDALYFHLYHIARDDVEYIMETFPLVKRKDEAAHGEYRTKRVILEMYD